MTEKNKVKVDIKGLVGVGIFVFLLSLAMTKNNLAGYYKEKYEKEYQKIIDCEENAPVGTVRCELKAVKVMMGERKKSLERIRLK